MIMFMLIDSPYTSMYQNSEVPFLLLILSLKIAYKNLTLVSRYFGEVNSSLICFTF